MGALGYFIIHHSSFDIHHLIMNDERRLPAGKGRNVE
jgi:hypothetical protein